jgi:hypothetical protein
MPCQLQLEAFSSDQQHFYLYHLCVSFSNLSTSLQSAPETEPPGTARSTGFEVDLSHKRQRSVELHHTAPFRQRRTQTRTDPTIYKRKHAAYKQETFEIKIKAVGVESFQEQKVKRIHAADHAKRGYRQHGQRQASCLRPSHRLRLGTAPLEHLLGRQTTHRLHTPDVRSTTQCGALLLDVAPLS